MAQVLTIDRAERKEQRVRSAPRRAERLFFNLYKLGHLSPEWARAELPGWRRSHASALEDHAWHLMDL